MSSNKSMITSKKTITTHMFLNILKNNKQLNNLKHDLNNNRIRCKLLWYTLNKLNEKIDNFENIYSNLDEKSQEKIINKLHRETTIIYKKYLECGEIDDDIEYDIEKLVEQIHSNYVIVDPPAPIMYISKYAQGTQKNKKRKKLKEKNKRKKTKGKKK